MLEKACQLSIVAKEFIEALDGEITLPADQASTAPVETREQPSEEHLRLLEACLRRLNPDIEYELWLSVCAAVFNESTASEDGYELFDRWSSGGDKYKGRRDTRAKWKSLRLDHQNPSTMGTLWWLLTKEGHDWREICREARDGFGEAGRAVDDNTNPTK